LKARQRRAFKKPIFIIRIAGWLCLALPFYFLGLRILSWSKKYYMCNMVKVVLLDWWILILNIKYA
jgi:hypothetical protein